VLTNAKKWVKKIQKIVLKNFVLKNPKNCVKKFGVKKSKKLC